MFYNPHRDSRQTLPSATEALRLYGRATRDNESAANTNIQATGIGCGEESRPCPHGGVGVSHRGLLEHLVGPREKGRGNGDA